MKKNFESTIDKAEAQKNFKRNGTKLKKDREKLFQITIALDLHGNTLKNLSNKDILLLFQNFQFMPKKLVQTILQLLQIKDRGRSVSIKYVAGQLSQDKEYNLPYWNIQLETITNTTAGAVKRALQKKIYDITGNIEKWSIVVKKKQTWQAFSSQKKFQTSCKEWSDCDFYLMTIPKDKLS